MLRRRGLDQFVRHGALADGGTSGGGRPRRGRVGFRSTSSERKLAAGVDVDGRRHRCRVVSLVLGAVRGCPAGTAVAGGAESSREPVVVGLARPGGARAARGRGGRGSSVTSSVPGSAAAGRAWQPDSRRGRARELGLDPRAALIDAVLAALLTAVWRGWMGPIEVIEVAPVWVASVAAASSWSTGRFH